MNTSVSAMYFLSFSSWPYDPSFLRRNNCPLKRTVHPRRRYTRTKERSDQIEYVTLYRGVIESFLRPWSFKPSSLAERLSAHQVARNPMTQRRLSEGTPAAI